MKKGVEEGKIPHAVVFATNKDGTLIEHTARETCS
jgi:hypothetical protein